MSRPVKGHHEYLGHTRSPTSLDETDQWTGNIVKSRASRKACNAVLNIRQPQSRAANAICRVAMRVGEAFKFLLRIWDFPAEPQLYVYDVAT
jgi:hypothetical protein